MLLLNDRHGEQPLTQIRRPKKKQRRRPFVKRFRKPARGKRQVKRKKVRKVSTIAARIRNLLTSRRRQQQRKKRLKKRKRQQQIRRRKKNRQKKKETQEQQRRRRKKNKRRRLVKRKAQYVGGGRVDGLSKVERDGDAEMQLFGNYTLVCSILILVTNYILITARRMINFSNVA